MYNEGQEEIVKAYELQWGAFTRADLERCRLKKLFHRSQHSSRMERKKTFPQSTDNTPHTYKVFTNVRLSMCLWTTWVWHRQNSFGPFITEMLLVLTDWRAKLLLFYYITWTEIHKAHHVVVDKLWEAFENFNTQKLDAPKLFFGTKTWLCYLVSLKLTNLALVFSFSQKLNFFFFLDKCCSACCVLRW